jgi:hypothetical protein
MVSTGRQFDSSANALNRQSSSILKVEEEKFAEPKVRDSGSWVVPTVDFRAKHSVTVIGLKWRFCVDGKSSVMECNVWMGGASAR